MTIALLLTTILTTGFFTNAGTVRNVNHSPANNIFTETFMYEGANVPHFILPVVEITAARPKPIALKTITLNGEVMPMIELEEVVISPNVLDLDVSDCGCETTCSASL